MLPYLLRRVCTTVLLLLGVIMVTFVVFYVVPSWGGVHDHLGSGHPVSRQFGDYVSGLLFGADYPNGAGVLHCPAPCFGFSARENQQILPLIEDRLPVTASIAVGAAAVWLVGGVAMGVASAVWRGGVVDRSTRVFALLGVCLPVFFLGPLARWYLRGVFPRPVYSSLLHNPVLWAQGLFLPWVTLAFGYFALYARLTRAGMTDAFNAHYTRTGRAIGLRERRVVRHALRVALPPLATVFAMDLGLLLGGAVLTELVFSLHGVGELAANAVDAQDVPVVLGVTLFAACFVVVANLLVDAVYAALDPRISR